MRRILALVMLLALALVPVAGASAQSTPVASPVAGGTGLEGAVAWLTGQQKPDGSFPGMTGESDPGTTLDAIVALAAARQAGVDTGSAVEKAVAYLEQGDTALVYAQTGVGQSAKLVLGLDAAGANIHDIAGVDPIMIVERGQHADTGIYGGGIFDHALALMALGVTGAEVPENALDALASTQAENGGWAFDASTDPASADTNTTAMVVQALVATGHRDSKLIAPALAYLQSAITSTGAVYAVNAGAIADANSTALVLQAFLATGNENASTLETVLHTFQEQDGAFFYQSNDMTPNLFSTVQAIPALAGKSLPVVPAAEATPQAELWLLAA